MSHIKTPSKKVTTAVLRCMKKKGKKITALTAYDATFAHLVDEVEIDIILIGDSLGMVIQGHDNTLAVSVDDIVYHTKAVKRGVKCAHLVADMPFMSYQASMNEAVRNAGRVIKDGGAESVKLEGGMELVETVRALTTIGIPVMAHIGLKPQTIHQMGGYKIQGKSLPDAEMLLKEATAFEEAGAYALLLEGVAAETASDISKNVGIPTIGIGSGPGCDGQILVIYDLLGMNADFSPKFLKKYANLAEDIKRSVKKYAEEVKDGSYPSEEHCFNRNLKAVVNSTDL